MTRVSVIVPCFDARPGHLAEALASVRAQTHPDLEIIVVDDGSTDPATRRALDQAEADGARVLRQQNQGLPAARNSGIALASGEYLLPLDADDLIEPDLIADSAAVLDTQPAIAIVGSGTRFFGDESGEEHPLPPRPVDWLVANRLPATALFRRSAWEGVGGYRVGVTHGEDWLLWVSIIAGGGGVEILPRVGLHYRRHASQMTHRVDDAVMARTRALVLEAGVPIIAANPTAFAEEFAGRLTLLDALRRRYRRPERLAAALRARRRRHPHL